MSRGVVEVEHKAAPLRDLGRHTAWIEIKFCGLLTSACEASRI